MNLVDELTYYIEFVFPQLSVKHKWPIRFDHCFRRVVYGTALSCVWNTKVKSPAYKNMTEDQLKNCIHICKEITEKPELMIELNKQSISWRKHG